MLEKKIFRDKKTDIDQKFDLYKERTVYMQPRDKIHRHKNTKLGKEARGIYSK